MAELWKWRVDKEQEIEGKDSTSLKTYFCVSLEANSGAQGLSSAGSKDECAEYGGVTHSECVRVLSIEFCSAGGVSTATE